MRGVVLILLGGLMWLTAAPVYAHAALVSAEPAPGATVAAVTEIRLTFSEPLAPGSTFTLFTDGFRAVPGIAPQVAGNEIWAALTEPLPPGTYTVQWKAISSTAEHTGHTVEGSYQFSVAESGAPANIGWVLLGGVIAAAVFGFGMIRRARQTRTSKE